MTEDREAGSPLVEGESISWLLDKVDQLAFRAPEDALQLQEWAARFHRYFDTNHAIVQATVDHDLPELAAAVADSAADHRAGTPKFDPSRKSRPEMTASAEPALTFWPG